MTGSIRGQSAAEPHAVHPQRDTLDYREAARRTIDEGQGSGGKQDDGNSRRGRGTEEWDDGKKGLNLFS